MRASTCVWQQMMLGLWKEASLSLSKVSIYKSQLTVRFFWFRESVLIQMNWSYIPCSVRRSHYYRRACGDGCECWDHSCSELSGRGRTYTHDRVVSSGTPLTGRRPLFHIVQWFSEDQQCPKGGHGWVWVRGSELAWVSSRPGHSHSKRWAGY